MQPLIWSTIDAKRSGLHWRRWGTNICYYQNTLKRRNGKRYFSLTMTMEFPRSDDRVFIAYCYPYTYTDLQRYLSWLTKSPETSQILQRRLLCQSLAGNGCDLLTITSPVRLSHSPARSLYIYIYKQINKQNVYIHFCRNPHKIASLIARASYSLRESIRERVMQATSWLEP